MKFFSSLGLLLLQWLAWSSAHSEAEPRDAPDPGPLAIIEPLLLISTLDGGLYAVGKRSGMIKWSLQEEPIVKLPNVTESLRQPLFLPDPKDGSLYIYNGVMMKGKKEGEGQEGKDSLEKLPFTISELVSASPCRSSDGLLYTGRKVDSWITINTKTGQKTSVLDSETPMCPKNGPFGETDSHHNDHSLFLGKSEYHLSIFDLKTREKRWNITLIDYSSSATLAIPQNSYNLLHLTSSTSGRIVTIDLDSEKENHKLLWSHQLGSPIVAIYQFNEGSFAQTRSVPFTTVGDPVTRPLGDSLDALLPSLYIGESESTKSAYALSAMVDLKQTRVMSTKNRHTVLPLLEGPSEDRQEGQTTLEEYFNFLIYGFYEAPDYSDTEITPQITIKHFPPNNLLTDKTSKHGSLPLVIEKAKKARKDQVVQQKGTDETMEHLNELVPILVLSLLSLFSSIGFGFWFHTKRRLNEAILRDKGLIKVGKISFDPKAIIGRGSAGTCVYSGWFEGKQSIAVKRVIADYYILANREIELLRSLHHPNLVRYFATESDEMFRYIAIELAATTLADAFSDRRAKQLEESELSPIEILRDSCRGLAHLHSLNVIHRDIKPQNILISVPLLPTGHRKVLISDFGVSKVLTHENSMTAEFISTTRVIKGTEGWIAPEVLQSKLDHNKEFKASKAIDIFSMGCLFYYVLTGGKHPFGDALERQSNILKDSFDLKDLKDGGEVNTMACSVVEIMISAKPEDRPTVESIEMHPLFWEKSKQLQFFQDVSDRIEKEPHDSEIVQHLEKGGFDVVKGDWKRFLSLELQTDLRKFRSYKGSSVRDLLRALRNKRHHYRELPLDVQESLGAIPEEFVDYFTSRFPRLLCHAYIAMQPYRFEPIFRGYYNQEVSWDFAFPALPRTGIRWFELNMSPKRAIKLAQGEPNGAQPSNGLDLVTSDISLTPNGMTFGNESSPGNLLNWRSCHPKASVSVAPPPGFSPKRKVNGDARLGPVSELKQPNIA